MDLASAGAQKGDDGACDGRVEAFGSISHRNGHPDIGCRNDIAREAVGLTTYQDGSVGRERAGIDPTIHHRGDQHPATGT
jgi:hypothetical protein